MKEALEKFGTQLVQVVHLKDFAIYNFAITHECRP